MSPQSAAFVTRGGRSQEGSAQRTAANSLFSFAAFAVTAVFVAVSTPIVVHHLGAEQYGILSLSLTIVNFLALLDAGISTTLVRFVADRRAVHDTTGLNRFVSASFAIYLIVGVLAVAATVVFAVYFSDKLFNFTKAGVTPAKFAFAFAGVAFLFTFLSKIFGAVILGLQRNDLNALLKIAITASTGIGTIVLVYVGFGVRALVLLSALVAAFGLAGYWVVARRLLPHLHVRPGAGKGSFASTLRFSGWIFLANTMAFLLFQLDRIFLGALKDVSLVTYYAIPGSVASYLYVAVANLASITIAVATGLFARQERERVVRLYVRATRFVLLFLIAFGIPALVLARPILKFWIGEAFADRSTGVFRLLILTHVALGLTVLSYNVVLAAGRPRILGLFNLLTLGANVVLILVLIPKYGLIGAAWAYLLSVLPLLLLLVYAERRLLHISQTHWATHLARLAVPTAAATAVSFAMLYAVGNLATVVLGAGTAAALLVGAYLAWFAPPEDRELMLGLVRNSRLRRLPPRI